MRGQSLRKEHRVVLAVLYALVLGAVMALENLVGIPDIVQLIIWLLAPVIGYLVGRWWVVFAVIGGLIGRTIGWDSAEHDGNPALWPAYVASDVLVGGFLLLVGVGVAVARDGPRRRDLRA
jgi:hypothetical protein